MPDGTCSSPACNRPAKIRGWCRMHYQRLRKEGLIETRGFHAADATCAVDGCTRPPQSVGMCSMHRRRVVKHGTTTPPPSAPWEPRFWDKVYPCPITGCWLWGASVREKRGGYGQFTVKHGTVAQSHRIAYELIKGPIPEGLVLDHLCRVTCCVNPDHLEPVTNVENVMRGMAPGIVSWRTNICKFGHELTPENTHYNSSHGRRRCRRCLHDEQRTRSAG